MVCLLCVMLTHVLIHAVQRAHALAVSHKALCFATKEFGAESRDACLGYVDLARSELLVSASLKVGVDPCEC